jgi:hypothetical protein
MVSDLDVRQKLTTSLPTDLMKADARAHLGKVAGIIGIPGRLRRNAPHRDRALVRFHTGNTHIGRWACSASVRRQSMDRFTDPKRHLFLRHHPDAVPAVNWWVFYEMAAALDINGR